MGVVNTIDRQLDAPDHDAVRASGAPTAATDQTPRTFDYHTAFGRNLGWVTEDEQAILRQKRVAVSGLGGVGGSHLMTLTRLGVGNFNITDLDSFELVNFNRQIGASMASLGQPKVDVLSRMALDVNPQLDIRSFPSGISTDNVEQFLDGVDLYVDGLDFFAVAARRAVFAACADLGIPAVTAAPIGMGAAFLAFLPGGMTFEQYFRLEGKPENEQLLRFLLGLTPTGTHCKYLVDPTRIDLANHRGPSTPMACELCAGVAGTNALKILLGRGDVIAAPRGLLYDAYSNRLARTWRPWGARNPVTMIALSVARRQMGKRQKATPQPAKPMSRIEKVLDLARWAPSGDNTQPWRFEIISDDHVVVHARDTRDTCVYDLQGHASQISVGAMLETLRLAASRFRLRTTVERRDDSPEPEPVFDVHLAQDATLEADELTPYITRRVTQRRPMKTTPLTTRQREALERAAGSEYQVIWLDTPADRRRMARLLFRNAHIRLTTREAYDVHKQVIEWNARYSEDRLPDKALGLNAVALKLMRWAMKDWKRIRFMNRYLAGTWLPRIELDYIPALRCAAHFVLIARNEPRTLDDRIAAGGALQRFWLTATRVGLHVQPEMTPLIFAGYVRDAVRFTQNDKAQTNAEKLADRLEQIIGKSERGRAVFMGRIGQAPTPTSRSIRLPLARLLKSRDPQEPATP